MNKKLLVTFCVALLWSSTHVNATQMPNFSYGDGSIKHFSGMDFSGQPLPKNLRGADLRNANFSGQHFAYTNFTEAQLEGAILTKTTCDYQYCFQENIRKNMFNDIRWYIQNLPQDLKSITKVYPFILQASHKAALLHIASALAYLPCYKDIVFHIKVQYWSCKMLLLKQQLNNTLGHKLFCSLASELSHDAENFCFQTDYPFHLRTPKGLKIACQWCFIFTSKPLPSSLATLIQHHLTDATQPMHANFDRYLKGFQEGLKNYNVKTKVTWSYNFYKQAIEQNIKGLAKAYPKLHTQALQKEAIYIAHTLSQSYKMQDWQFLFHYLFCQNRLVELKIAAGVATKNDIYYNVIDHSYL